MSVTTDKTPTIEVTPEMIDAGETAYYEAERYYDDPPINAETLVAIYRAMLAATPIVSSTKQKTGSSAVSRR